MKKIFLVVLALSFSSVFAADKVSTITCHVKEEKLDVTVEFLVKNLGSAKAELLQHPRADADMGAIFVTPKESTEHYTLMMSLNGQGGDLRVSEDKIRLFGDDDGIVFVDLVLYKDTNYTKGYVRVSGDTDQMYQNISCSIK